MNIDSYRPHVKLVRTSDWKVITNLEKRRGGSICHRILVEAHSTDDARHKALAIINGHLRRERDVYSGRILDMKIQQAPIETIKIKNPPIKEKEKQNEFRRKRKKR